MFVDSGLPVLSQEKQGHGAGAGVGADDRADVRRVPRGEEPEYDEVSYEIPDEGRYAQTYEEPYADSYENRYEDPYEQRPRRSQRRGRSGGYTPKH